MFGNEFSLFSITLCPGLVLTVVLATRPLRRMNLWFNYAKFLSRDAVSALATFYCGVYVSMAIAFFSLIGSDWYFQVRMSSLLDSFCRKAFVGPGRILLSFSYIPNITHQQYLTIHPLCVGRRYQRAQNPQRWLWIEVQYLALLQPFNFMLRSNSTYYILLGNLNFWYIPLFLFLIYHSQFQVNTLNDCTSISTSYVTSVLSIGDKRNYQVLISS